MSRALRGRSSHCPTADEETEAERGLLLAQGGVGSRPLLRASKSPALWEVVGSGSKPTLQVAGGLECGARPGCFLGGQEGGAAPR